jgi:lipoate-protein ligase A
VAGLRDLGVPAGLSGDDAPALPPDAGPCFRSPAPGEVVLRGRKLVGSAQARIGETLLQHGSLLIHDDQGLLAAARGGGGGGGRGLHPPDPPSGAIALAEVSDPPPPVDAIVPALIQGLSAALGGDWTDGADDPTFSPSVEEAWRQHYGDASWTWRR